MREATSVTVLASWQGSWHPGEESAPGSTFQDWRTVHAKDQSVDSPGVCEKRKCSMAGSVWGGSWGECVGRKERSMWGGRRGCQAVLIVCPRGLKEGRLHVTWWHLWLLHCCAFRTPREGFAHLLRGFPRAWKQRPACALRDSDSQRSLLRQEVIDALDKTSRLS